MPNWDATYWNLINEKFDTITDGLKERVDDIGDGRSTPALEDIKIGSGRKMRAATLFFDIKGFTKRTNSADVDKLKESLFLLNCVIPMVMKIIYDYGGYIEKNTGDGIMAIIGAEESDSNSADNAIDSALAIFYTLKHLVNPYLEKQNIATVDARIGIDLGTLLISRIGLPTGTSKHKRNFLTAVGPSSNLACKIEGMAGTNEIWTGDLIKSNSRENIQKHFVKKTPADWTWSYNNSNKTYDIWHFNAVRTEPK